MISTFISRSIFLCLLVAVLSLEAKVKQPNYYQVLGIDSNATSSDIRKAFRAKSLEFHPDRNAGNATEAKVMFVAVGKAYEVLKDSESRRAYDLGGIQAVEDLQEEKAEEEHRKAERERKLQKKKKQQEKVQEDLSKRKEKMEEIKKLHLDALKRENRFDNTELHSFINTTYNSFFDFEPYHEVFDYDSQNKPHPAILDSIFISSKESLRTNTKPKKKAKPSFENEILVKNINSDEEYVKLIEERSEPWLVLYYHSSFLSKADVEVWERIAVLYSLTFHIAAVDCDKCKEVCSVNDIYSIAAISIHPGDTNMRELFRQDFTFTYNRIKSIVSGYLADQLPSVNIYTYDEAKERAFRQNKHLVLYVKTSQELPAYISRITVSNLASKAIFRTISERSAKKLKLAGMINYKESPLLIINDLRNDSIVECSSHGSFQAISGCVRKNIQGVVNVPSSKPFELTQLLAKAGFCGGSYRNPCILAGYKNSADRRQLIRYLMNLKSLKKQVDVFTVNMNSIKPECANVFKKLNFGKTWKKFIFYAPWSRKYSTPKNDLDKYDLNSWLTKQLKIIETDKFNGIDMPRSIVSCFDK